MALPVVCVVGGGTAGLEGLLMARHLLRGKARLRLITPEREFRYRPMSADSLFRPSRERALRIADLAAHTEAELISDRVALVREDEGTLLTRDGDTVDFDFLLMAPGSTPTPALRLGHVWARGGDASSLDDVLRGALAGGIRSLGLIVPRGARWPLPAYELSLVVAWTAARSDVRITLITAEDRPLGTLGSIATELALRELETAGVEVISGVEVIEEKPEHTASPEGMTVWLQPHSADTRAAVFTREFDRLISLPTVNGPHIAGLPTDAAGFVEVDATLKVCGSERVWAAGACVASALEHNALGAQQADAAATAVAAEVEGANASPATGPDLAIVMLDNQREMWLAENPPGSPQPSTRCLWWPPGRAVGQMLAGHIAAWDPSVHDVLPGHPDGVLIRTPVALSCRATTSPSAPRPLTREDRMARLRDIETRQMLAVGRREREAEAELRTLSERLRALGKHQEEVARILRRQGYLRAH